MKAKDYIIVFYSRCHVRREECESLASGGSEMGRQPADYADRWEVIHFLTDPF